MHACLTSLLADTPQSRVGFAKGHLIYDEGDPSDGIYRVIEGCVRLQINGDDGTRQIVRFLMRGDYFGLCPQYRTTSAEAVTKVVLSKYSLNAVYGHNSFNSSTAKALISEEASGYQELSHHVAQMVSLSAMDRVKAFYKEIRLRSAQNGNSTEAIPISQRDVADYLGIAPETLSRCLQASHAHTNRREAKPLASKAV